MGYELRVKKMPKVPYFRQKRDYSCGPASLRMILSYFGLEIDEEKLIELCGTSRLGTSRFQIVEAATKVKFRADTFAELTMEQIYDILEANLPIIALIDPGKIYGGISGIGHFVVILGRMDNKVVYHDPVMGQNLVTEEEIFFQAWQGSNFRGVRIWKSTER